MDSPRFLTGQYLLAMPGIGDPRFERAVIAVCAHDEDGALGVGIGAVIDGLGLHALLDQFDIDRGQAPDRPVHFGGPVETTRGFVLHSTDWGGQDTIDVAGRWALTGTIDILKAIAAGRGPSQWIVALGYAGWGAGQLDGEMQCHGWFSTPAIWRYYTTRPRTAGPTALPRRGSIRACSARRQGRLRQAGIVIPAKAGIQLPLLATVSAAAKPRRRSALKRRRPVEAMRLRFAWRTGARRSRLRLDI